MESKDMYKNGIPQFDGQKYAFWSRRMKTHNRNKDLKFGNHLYMDTKNQ
jgi:hypothetical protein